MRSVSSVKVSPAIGLPLAVALLAIAVGCGAGHERETARVSGRVTLDGEPLSSGYVMVLPTKGRMARGAVQEDGTIVLGSYGKSDGAQIGDHPVVVTPVPSDEGGRSSRSNQEIPRRYHRARTSGLRLVVEPSGTDSWLIELTSDS